MSICCCGCLHLCSWHFLTILCMDTCLGKPQEGRVEAAAPCSLSCTTPAAPLASNSHEASCLWLMHLLRTVPTMGFCSQGDGCMMCMQQCEKEETEEEVSHNVERSSLRCNAKFPTGHCVHCSTSCRPAENKPQLMANYLCRCDQPIQRLREEHLAAVQLYHQSSRLAAKKLRENGRKHFPWSLLEANPCHMAALFGEAGLLASQTC